MYEVNAHSDRDDSVLLSRRVSEDRVDRTMAEIAARDLGQPFHLVAQPYTPIWSKED